MNSENAWQIIQKVVEGVDPITGEDLPKNSLLSRGDLVPAFVQAVQVLTQDAELTARRSQLHVNVGRIWSKTEEVRLSAGYRSGVTVDELALQFARTPRAIKEDPQTDNSCR